MDSPRPAPELPPGFRFHPTDEELVVHYLKCKLASMPLPVSIIAEINLYKYDPWDLPAKASFGEKEWYFFSPRDRKYPNGARPNRAAASGYWKATGTDKPIFTRSSSSKVGVKKALVFYRGKPPKGIKTNWIMHEYRLTTTTDTSARSTPFHPRKTLRLDDWVLCRIYKKVQALKQEEDSFTVAEQIPPPSSSTMNDNYYPKLPFFPRLGSFGSLFPLDDQHPTYTNIDTFFMDMNTNPSTETTTNTATATATTRPASEMLPCLIPSKGETEEGGIEYGFRGIGGERNYIDGFGNLMHKNAFIPTNLQPNMLQWPFLDSRCTI